MTNIVRNVDIPNGFDLNSCGQESETPQPIGKPLSDVAKMTPDILPKALCGWLVDIAESKQVPLDFPVAAAVTLLSGLIGSRIGIRPKRYDDWLVMPNLWGFIVGSPSAMKTPVINDVSKPIKKLEIGADDSYNLACKDFAVAAELRKIETDNIKKEMKQGVTDERTDKLKALMNDDDAEPIKKRYLANDATIEKIGVILNENSAGITILRDELSGLMASWERSGHEQDKAFFLEAWNGNGTFQVDRIGRASLFIKKLCLSVFGGIQPSKLAGYFKDAMNGTGNDGMLQRFQIAVYPDQLPTYKYTDQYADARARAEAYRVFEQLAAFNPMDLACVDEYEEIPYMRFTEEAQPIFRSWLESLENTLRSGELPPLLEEHLGKYRSLVPSLALIFHLVEYASLTANDSTIIDKCKQGVSTDALNKAIQFTKYLESHAKRIYSSMGDSGQQAAYQLSKKIADEKVDNNFTVRDVQRKGWHLLTDNGAISEAVKVLVSANWLTEIEPQITVGRPAAIQYCINPKTKQFYENT